ncbi:MAG: acetyltransferase [Bacillota bacterium]|nr:MAG: acetyltransferase [Bacillota bacterium]
MTEREKMLGGMLYNPADKELRAMQRRVRALTEKYNRAEPEDRPAIMREILGGCGEHFYFEPAVRFDYGVNTFIGEHFYANFNMTILDCAKVCIGRDVMCGPNVTLATPVHPLLIEDRKMRMSADGEWFDYEYAKPITIEDGAWLASCVTVNGGVTIGKNSVIGSGSVVTRDIPAGVFAAGAPCRVIRKLTEQDKMNLPE